VFKTVFICTGNRARSAIAESYFRKSIAGLPVEVMSAGTLNLEPGPALPEAVEAARSHGLDLTPHRSQPLGGLELGDVDLVIGFEQQHVATAVVDAGVPPDRVFLIRELVRLLPQVPAPSTDDPIERARRILDLVNHLRSGGRFVPGEELPDPIGQGKKAFVVAADSITSALDDIVLRLFRR
jgi:protein-tyrosine-phosphatase